MSTSGLTLIEILIAILLLGGSGLAVAATLGAARRLERLTEAQRRATVVLADRTERTRGDIAAIGCRPTAGSALRPLGIVESWRVSPGIGSADVTVEVSVPSLGGALYRDSLRTLVSCP